MSMWSEARAYAHYQGQGPDDREESEPDHYHICQRCGGTRRDCFDKECTLPIVYDCEDCTKGFDRPEEGE